MDRTVATGTGFIGQYPPEVAAMYTSLKTCPDSLLLFMHHEPYTYRLHTGKTVIQTIYEDHYEGAQEAAGLVHQWRTLDGLIDPERYGKTLGLLEYQAGHAIVWRDAIDRWFEKMSGIPDDRGRIDHDPNRIVAAQMQPPAATPTRAANTPPARRPRILTAPLVGTMSGSSTSITARGHRRFGCFSISRSSPHGLPITRFPARRPTETPQRATLCVACRCGPGTC
jgi:hypothetical protein